MKIIITSPSLNVNDNVSGISSVTQFIINYLSENEYLHFELGKKDNEKRNLFWFFRILKTYFKWFNLLITERGSLIHFNLALSKPSIIRDSPLILLARIFQKHMVIHIHGGGFLMHKLNPSWMNRLLRLVLSGRNQIIVLSSLEKEILEQKFNLTGINVLPNCPALKEASEFNRIFPNSDILKLLFLGRISSDKGIDYIYQASEKLKMKGIRFKFFMAGAGPEERSYVEKFSNLLGNDFDFQGIVTGNQKTELLKECNVFLLPSFYEGLPMALLESMSFGLAPITTNVGSIRNVIEDGINGIFVKSHSSEDIVCAVEKLSREKDYMMQLSKNARNYIFTYFNPISYITRLNEIYNCE